MNVFGNRKLQLWGYGQNHGLRLSKEVPRVHSRAGESNVKHKREQKEKDVISLCSRNKPAKEVAKEHGVARESIYNWKRQLLKWERVYSIGKGKSGKKRGLFHRNRGERASSS